MVDESPNLLAKAREPRTKTGISSRSVEYGPTIRRLAYELWLVRANRNCQRTARMLREEVQDDLPPPYPTARIIQKWAQEEEWELQADQAFESIFQVLNARRHQKLFLEADQAYERMATIARMEARYERDEQGEIRHDERGRPIRVDPRTLAVEQRANEKLVEWSGLGTSGGLFPPTPPMLRTNLPDTSNKTPQELAEELRQRILEAKAQVKGRGNE